LISSGSPAKGLDDPANSKTDKEYATIIFLFFDTIIKNSRGRNFRRISYLPVEINLLTKHIQR
jgi:hypothetical protein